MGWNTRRCFFSVLTHAERFSAPIRARQGQQTLVAIAVLCAAFCFPSDVYSSGSEWNGSQDDLQVSVDYRWPGCRVGGYYPLRIRLTNRGPSRTIEAKYAPSNSYPVPTVTRRIKIDQNSTAPFTLLIPLVSSYGHGWLTFADETGDLESLRHSLSLPEADLTNSRPSLLVVSNRPIDCSAFESSASTTFGSSRSLTSDNELVSPSRLPENWLAYTGVDMIAIERDSLESLSNEKRAALTQWVHAGGSLIVHVVGEKPKALTELDELLELHKSVDARGWVVMDQGLDGNPLRDPSSAFQDTQAPLEELTLEELVALPGGRMVEEPKWFPADVKGQEQNWIKQLSLRRVGFGSIVALEQTFESGSTLDWTLLFNTLGAQNIRSGSRLGVAGRSDNSEFLHFVIPGIQSIPPIAFLIFISVFTFIIGPLNYFFLAKRRHLNLLVVTIPVLALATSVLLFGYSAVAHGFGIKSRLRSVTILDQGNQTAVSITRMALYAGSAPSEGLRFSTSTAVIPIYPSGSTFEYGSVDWTKEQALETGWLRSRTRTQFLTTSVRPERGRLTINSTANSGEIKNGLEWDVEGLLVVDAKGELFYGENIAAGSAGTLAPLSIEHCKQFTKLLIRSTPAEPTNLENQHDARMFDDFGRRRRYYSEQVSFHVSTSGVERRINGLRNLIAIRSQSEDVKHKLPDRTYYGFVKQTPGIELGVDDVDIVDEWHLVIGHY